MFPTLKLVVLAVVSMMAHAAVMPRLAVQPRAVNILDCDPDRAAKIKTALSDAAALANIAATTISRTSTAFTHYLRAADGDKAVAFWKKVAANNDPSTVPYSFTIQCAKSCTGVNASSLAVTDSTPQNGPIPQVMTICPRFFTHDQTKNDLHTKSYVKDKRGGWCQAGQTVSNFLTAGHTLLHEMTHLDAVGLAAGVPARTDTTGFTTHGTDDVDASGFKDDYVKAARALLTDWVTNPGSLPAKAIQPWENAESLAAAATEWWFLQSCGFTDIAL